VSNEPSAVDTPPSESRETSDAAVPMAPELKEGDAQAGEEGLPSNAAAQPSPSGPPPLATAEHVPPAAAEETIAPAPASGPGAILMQFIVFPFAIVLVCILTFSFFTWLFKDRKSYDEYLQAIVSGWKTEQWQAAYELQFRITDPRDDLRKTANVPATLSAFELTKRNRDQRIRAQLAIVLGHIGDMSAGPALVEALQDTNQETRLNAIWSLGHLKYRGAVPYLINMVDNEKTTTADTRDSFLKMIAYSLGNIGDESAKDALVKLIGSEAVAADVRWNAALALAKFKDPRAYPTLKGMIDRRSLNQFKKMQPKAKEAVMVNALRALHLLGATELRETLQFLASDDESYRVRQAALELLAELDKTKKKP